MKLLRSVPWLAFVLSLGAGAAAAAIREPQPGAGAVRVLADAMAEQPAPAPHTLQAPVTTATAATAATADAARDVELRRELLERSNLMNQRFDALDAKVYEIVGRLQLLAGCLIALFLGLAVWQISISRQIAQLRGRQVPDSGGLR